jgi:hypothetical protein
MIYTHLLQLGTACWTTLALLFLELQPWVQPLYLLFVVVVVIIIIIIIIVVVAAA